MLLYLINVVSLIFKYFADYRLLAKHFMPFVYMLVTWIGKSFIKRFFNALLINCLVYLDNLLFKLGLIVFIVHSDFPKFNLVLLK